MEFKTDYNEKTNELSTKSIADYHFCKIIIHKNLNTKNETVLFQGSIHKMWNSLNDIKAPNYKTAIFKGFNGNQFNLNQIIEIRNHLMKLFDCSVYQMIFQNIEVGINTQPNFNSQLFINGLLYHKGVMFENRYNRAYAQVQHKRFIIKIYNKGLQYGMNKNTLRIEVKVLKMIELKKFGVITFEDINENTLNKLFAYLLRRFDEVVYYDKTINKKRLLDRQKQLLPKYSNKTYWIDDVLPQHRDRQKKKLNEFIKLYSDNLRAQIREDLINKCVIINSSNIELNVTQKQNK